MGRGEGGGEGGGGRGEYGGGERAAGRLAIGRGAGVLLGWQKRQAAGEKIAVTVTTRAVEG